MTAFSLTPRERCRLGEELGLTPELHPGEPVRGPKLEPKAHCFGKIVILIK